MKKLIRRVMAETKTRSPAEILAGVNDELELEEHDLDRWEDAIRQVLAEPTQ